MASVKLTPNALSHGSSPISGIRGIQCPPYSYLGDKNNSRVRFGDMLNLMFLKIPHGKSTSKYVVAY